MTGALRSECLSFHDRSALALQHCRMHLQNRANEQCHSTQLYVQVPLFQFLAELNLLRNLLVGAGVKPELSRSFRLDCLHTKCILHSALTAKLEGATMGLAGPSGLNTGKIMHSCTVCVHYLAINCTGQCAFVSPTLMLRQAWGSALLLRGYRKLSTVFDQQNLWESPCCSL